MTFEAIETVTKGRIGEYYQTGTEFIIFIFTSDWFLGRDDFAPLPKINNQDEWSAQEKTTVLEADSLFGSQDWQLYILNDEPIEKREQTLIELYRKLLHRWFRYVLPLPFNPKGDQIFHLILCSNFEDGVKRTKDFYSDKTGNPRYKPSNDMAYSNFQKLHPVLTKGLTGRQRSPQWRILWNTITKHEEGICDEVCKDFKRDGIGYTGQRQDYLNWLEEKGYVLKFDVKDAWDSSIKKYILNWSVLKSNLGVEPPLPLIPLKPEMLKNGKI